MATIKKLSVNEKMQMVAEAREDALRVERERISSAFEQGRAEGRKKGREQGIAKGLSEGFEQGRMESTVSIAQKMKEMGMDPAAIAKATGLSVEEVGKL
jgi:predicted transposase YdaD